MSIYDNPNPDIRAIGMHAVAAPGSIPALDVLVNMLDRRDHAWNLALAYNLGRIHGKREERARRRKVRTA